MIQSPVRYSIPTPPKDRVAKWPQTRVRPRGEWCAAKQGLTFHRIRLAWATWPTNESVRYGATTYCGRRFERANLFVEPPNIELCDHCTLSDPFLWAVYRIYDATGHVLYIGCSRMLFQRLEAHRSAAEWWPLAASYSYSAYASETAALRREVAEQYTHNPRMNFPKRSRPRVGTDNFLPLAGDVAPEFSGSGAIAHC